MSNATEPDPYALDLFQRSMERMRQRRAARLAAAQPPTAAEKAEARFAAKPTEAQDVELSSNALAQRLLEERLSGRRFTEQEIANRQAIIDRGYVASVRLQAEIVLCPYHSRSMTIGRHDSDAGLHVSPEDQIWQ
jgi:hypothetical protein